MRKLNLTYSDFFVALTVFLFLLIKLSTLSVHFGDGNVYVFASNQLLHGFLPYKDLFVVVPPFLIYFIAIFAIFFQSHLLLYSLIPIICEIFSSIFVYLILKKLQISLAWLAPFIYLFSFTILATTDYLSGVAVVNFLVSLALFLLINNRALFSGVIFGLALMTKLYVLPVILGITITFILAKQYQKLTTFLSGILTTSILILSPFLIFSPQLLFRDLILHQLNRPSGLDKLTVLGFFISKEFIILITASLSFFFANKHKYLFLFPLILLGIFFVLFSDIYYLYLASLLPFLCLLSVISLSKIWQILPNYHQLIAIVFGITAIFIVYQSSNYLSNTAPLGHFDNSFEIGQYITSLPKPYPLYGSHDIAPALALLSKRPLFQNVFDTNPQTFSSKANDVDKLSSLVAEKGVYLVARTINRPELQTTQIGFEGYFSTDVFARSCTKLKDFPSLEIEIYNQITIYECKNK